MRNAQLFSLPWPQSEPATRSGVNALCALLALTLLTLLAAVSVWLWQAGRQPLLLAPAIGGLNECLQLRALTAPQEPACTGEHGSAAARVKQALDALGPRRSADGHFELGYTLVVPLLNLFEPDAQGGWQINREALGRIARTVEQVDAPVVLYLFSTHFSELAPIEPALAQDPHNMAETPAGPLPVDHYMGRPLYPWSVARLDNGITQRREQAMDAIAAALCRLPPAARGRIAGINVLGEAHQLYPDYETGMGYGWPYVLTDYSAASRQGFAEDLRRRFGSVQALNAWLGSDFTDFAQAAPPSKDPRREPLDNDWQHLDATAAGAVPVSGWVHDGAQPPSAATWVRVYLNGRLAARVPAHSVRQDVAQALPNLGTANVGWRYDLRYSGLPPGRHRIDVALERAAAHLIHLGTRHFTVMERQSSAPPADQPMRQPLPPMALPDAGVAFWIDAPQENQVLRYNPLVPLWHAFREQQVVNYLEHFDHVLDQSCLADVPRNTQQIYPAEQAGWDESRFASAQSLLPFGHMGLGINLYGEATYDDSFFDWLARSRQPDYSITEFHPLRVMSASELRQTLERHRARGARRLSFFLHPPDAGGHMDNPFAFDPANPAYGSDQLYRAMREVLGER
ncbi:MAG: hypothetical protein LBI48_10765 [Burkholderiaceae bacterium]|jgi:hypothetical protein|nr:hypothetical protein [Burkholderiaceae bacterium]